MDIFLGSLVQLSVGMEEGCKQILLASVGSARSVSATLGSPRSRRVCFPCQHCLGSRLLCRELSEDGPELYALPSSKPLRFRYWGIPQRHRLGWTCILYPSQVRAAQVTRCLVSTVSFDLSPPHPCRSVFWVYNWHHLLSRMSTIQNPKNSWIAMKSA